MKKQINAPTKSKEVQSNLLAIRQLIRIYSGYNTLTGSFRHSIGVTIFLVIVVISNMCFAQNTNNDTIIIEAYSSYSNTDLPSPLGITNQTSNYSSTIDYALSLIGLPNSDIEVASTPTFGAFSIINKQSQRRFFLYSPAFFDSVYNVTHTNLAILSICFHELAHQFYRHPLKPSYASHIYEKQADRYSGFQMCIIGATLEQSLIAMKSFGSEAETQTHPDKLSRLAEIEKGYIDAKIIIFKDSSYIMKDNIFKSVELMSALFEDESLLDIQNMSNSSEKVNSDTKKAVKRAVKKTNTKQVYSFYGELIYLTNDKEIKLASNYEKIGDVLEQNRNMQSKILNLEGVKFYLEDKKIYSVNPDGLKLEVGNKITN